MRQSSSKRAHIHLLSLMAFLFACNSLNRTTKPKFVVPRMIVKSSAATPVDQYGGTIENIKFDQNGRVLHEDLLTISLDYLPEPITGTAGLPSCLRLEDGLELGVVVCSQPSGRDMLVYGRHFRRNCRVHQAESQDRAVGLIFPGCQQGNVMFHQFSPPVRAEAPLR